MLVDDLISYVSSDGRICPSPVEWDRVSRIIGVAKPGHQYVPLILAGWAFSSDLQKRQRLIAQIKFAETLGEEQFESFSQALYRLKKKTGIVDLSHYPLGNGMVNSFYMENFYERFNN